MSRQLAAYETTNGRLYGIDPAHATGIPIPAFRVVNAVPVAGQTPGEAVLLSTNGTSYVWGGTPAVWNPIVPPSIVPYATDADVLSDGAAAPGTYAFSRATGNLFVRFTEAGANVWRQIGTTTFATQAAMFAVTTGIAEGSQAFVTADNSQWQWLNGQWRIQSTVSDTDANIRALLASVYSGGVAIATDTAKIYFSDGVTWVSTPWRDYPTEADLLADTPGTGTLAVAIDTGGVWYFDGANWIATNRQTIPSGATDPATATSVIGDLFLNTTTGSVKYFSGTVWTQFAVTTINDLTDVDTLTTPPTDGQLLRYDGATSTWVPATIPPAVILGAEPALATRVAGMLWWTTGKLFVWDSANVWVQV